MPTGTFPAARLRQAGVSAARVTAIQATYAGWTPSRQHQFRAWVATSTDERIRAAYQSQDGGADPAGDGEVGVDATDVGYDVVLLLGQSNMIGLNTDFDSRLDPAHSRVYSFDYGGTYAHVVVGALDPLYHQGEAAGVGPGMPFARWYSAATPANRQVLLVPLAVSGTPLAATTGGTWNSGVRGSLYDNAVTQARAALAAAGGHSRIVAALWVQGESDGDGAVTTAAYAAVLDALIARLRSDLGVPRLPFVIGGMVPEGIAARAAYAAVAAAHADTPSRVAYTAYVPGPIGYQKGDNLHYNAAGQRVQGRQMAAGLSAAVANSSPAPRADTTAPTIISFTATAGDGQVALAWAGSDDAGVARWTVTRGGTTVYDGAGAGKADAGLTNGTAYTYTLTAYDAAGNTKTATASATPAAAGGGGSSADFGPALTAWAGTPTYSAGKFGQAASGAVFQVPLDWTSIGDHTFEAWVNVPASASGGPYVLSGGNGYFGLQGGRLTGSNGTAASGAVNDGAWHHIARTSSGANETYWLDGQPVGTFGGQGHPGSGLGSYNDGTPQFNWPGLIDEVRYSKVVRYTDPFTPPAAPFTADADTLALYHLDG